MKNFISIILILILATSCDSKKFEELNNRIVELENMNVKLTDSLDQHVYQRVISSYLVGIPHENDLIPNKPNKFTFLFPSIQKLPAYNVYRITRNGKEETKDLLYGNYTEPEFEFNFVPENEDDNSFVLLSEFNLDSIRVVMPGSIDMNLSE